VWARQHEDSSIDFSFADENPNGSVDSMDGMDASKRGSSVGHR
jgi:hypothetical protein